MSNTQVLEVEGETKVGGRVAAQAPAGAVVQVLPGWRSRGAEGETNVMEKS